MTLKWEEIEHEGRTYYRRTLGHFYVDILAEWTSQGRPFRLVEAPTSVVLYEGVTTDSLDRAMRCFEHMLAARSVRSTREVPCVD